MKKRLFVVGIAAAALGTISLPAFAEEVETPLATVTVEGDQNQGRIAIDGAAGNPDPIDGFVSAQGSATGGSGSVCADDNGSPDDGNPENGAESTSPTCAP